MNSESKQPRWQRRAEDRPREICAAALEVFAEKGFAAAKLDEIENELKAQLDEMRERGLAAPFPAELHAREFKD